MKYSELEKNLKRVDATFYVMAKRKKRSR